MFNMQGCKLVNVPMSPHTKLQLFEESEETNATHFRCLVGKLLHLSHSRPDIMFSINLLSRFMTKATRIHFVVAKHILKYLAGTSDLEIQYSRNISLTLAGYTDSDWCGDLRDRKKHIMFCI